MQQETRFYQHVSSENDQEHAREDEAPEMLKNNEQQQTTGDDEHFYKLN